MLTPKQIAELDHAPDADDTPQPLAPGEAESISKTILQNMLRENLQLTWSLAGVDNFIMARIQLNEAFRQLDQLEALAHGHRPEAPAAIEVDAQSTPVNGHQS